VNWLTTDAFTVLGQNIIWSDLIGNTLGLAALALGWLRNVWTWPLQLVSGLVLIAANLAARAWTLGRKESQDGTLQVRFATWRERGLLAAGAVAGTLAVGGLFTLFPSLSWSPWADAYIFVGTLVAMYAQAKGMVEFWFAWLLVDLVGVPLNFASGLAFSGLIYLVYGALVLWGMRDWWLRSRAAQRPVLEGTPA
jgi:nicotinamide mononucleotide transporter